MKINRLRYIRDKILKMTQEEMADRINEAIGQPDKWYLQRVARIESGSTKLNEEMVAEIITAFPQIHPGQLFAVTDGETEYSLSQEERDLIKELRAMREQAASGNEADIPESLKAFFPEEDINLLKSAKDLTSEEKKILSRMPRRLRDETDKENGNGNGKDGNHNGNNGPETKTGNHG